MARINSCANCDDDGTKEPCPKEASMTCSNCRLVRYCGKECQVAHWAKHKTSCRSSMSKPTWEPSWEVENRTPSFVIGEDDVSMATFGGLKYMWGNVPAMDIFKMERNEGVSYAKDLRILFAASGDLRNVIKSILGLPDGFEKRCEVFINDRDGDIVARNAILLLTALCLDYDTSVEAMIHIWYSVLMPWDTLHSVREAILPLINDVCAKTEGKDPGQFLGKTWKFGSRELRLVLTRYQWTQLPTYLETSVGFNESKARSLRASVTMAPERVDYVHRFFCTQPPEWRVARARFREDGILLPFGASRKDFDTPNPTFFSTKGSWPMKDSADPLGGWDLKETLKTTGPANNDLYGGLYYYLKDLLRRFFNRLSVLDVSFHLTQMDAVDLPNHLNREKEAGYEFDRIEVSNIADMGYLGPAKTLSTFGRLLRTPKENPHAALITLFLNATHEVWTDQDRLVSAAAQQKQLGRYLKPAQSPRQLSQFSPDMIKILSAMDLFRNFDELFARYMNGCRFEEIAKDAGLVMKTKNGISDPWPMRLGKDASQPEYDLLVATDLTGSERYVEWKRLDG